MSDFYKKTTSSYGFYGTSVSGTEANLRQELINTLDGSFPEIAKGQTALLRKVRRDDLNKSIECPCVDSFTREPDRDRYCPICLGEGFLFDEIEINLYRVLQNTNEGNAVRPKLYDAGLINIPLVVFYVRYSEVINYDDKRVLLELQETGVPVEPRRRVGIYSIGSIWDYRADNGKLEYWKLATFELKVKYLNTPNYRDV